MCIRGLCLACLVTDRLERQWPLAVILSGWTILAGGLYRIIAPRRPHAAETPRTYVMLAVIMIRGAAMSWQGYRRRR